MFLHHIMDHVTLKTGVIAHEDLAKLNSYFVIIIIIFLNIAVFPGFFLYIFD